jgi:Methyltransferase domain
MMTPTQNLVRGLKNAVRSCFALFGFQIVRVKGPEPRITGTFPPHTDYTRIGNPKDYFIHQGYCHRSQAIYFDDTEHAAEWQKEVYRFAREVFDEHALKTVCDLGCGSAYKLIRYFGDRHIVGMDVAKTCEWLREEYPQHTWIELDFEATPPLKADLVIAADVVEHLLDPDLLLSYIAALSPEYIILSTPDRNLLRAGTHNGPPHNPSHIREWSFAEFEAYVSSRFEVLEHFISNPAQATQCVLCSRR